MNFVLTFNPKLSKLSDPISKEEKKIARENYKKRVQEFNSLDRNLYEFNSVDKSRFIMFPHSFDLSSCLRVNKEKQRYLNYIEEIRKKKDDDIQMKYYDYILTLRDEKDLVEDEDEDDMFYDGYLIDNSSSDEEDYY